MDSDTSRPTAAASIERGNGLFRQGRIAEALASFDEAVELDALSATAHSNRAHALNALERPAEAIVAAASALALDGSLFHAWRAKGTAHMALGAFDAALESFRGAASLASPAQRAGALSDVGVALAALGRYRESLAAYDEAVQADPGAALIRSRRASGRLLLGDYAAGWDDYESRWWPGLNIGAAMGQMTEDLRQRLTLHPTPDDLRGRRVLVVAEQGIGDQVMFASVLPDLAAVAAHVTCLVEPRLLRLLGGSFPQIEMVAGHGPAIVDPGQFDHVLAIGSLPVAFRRSVDAFPGQPYLRAQPAVTQAWRARLGPRRARLRVGLSWRGGTQLTSGARSIPLEVLRPLLERPDCEFVSLQYGDVAAELEAFNAGLRHPIESFPAAEIDDFEQLAGLTEALDVIVTVQTTLAHLTGAIGQRGLVMIPSRPEWRYRAAGSDIPWYRSLRLVRQEGAQGWAPVIARIGQALDGVAPGPPVF